MRSRLSRQAQAADLSHRPERSMVFFFSSRRRHTRFDCDWGSDVCSSDLQREVGWLLGELPLTMASVSTEISGAIVVAERSEERRVGKECRSRWSPYP